jgi:epoxyqueuosine reductase QueG
MTADAEPDAELTQDMERFALECGADLVGVADLTPARVYLADRGSAGAAYPLAVSMGMRLNDAIVDSHDPAEGHRESQYWHHVYSIVTPALDVLAYQLARWLARRGFDALPVPGSMPYNLERLEGRFSHKLAAHLAGLGWVGNNSLLLTSRLGPRLRLVTVLTDAPLAAGMPLDGRCGRCRICVDECPVDALSGVEFDPTDELALRFDARRCSEYRRQHACGRCVAVCPVGSSRKGRGGRVPLTSLASD